MNNTLDALPDVSDDIDEALSQLDRQMEDLLIVAMQIRTKDGLHMAVSYGALKDAYMDFRAGIEQTHHNPQYRIHIPFGSSDNEE